MFSLVLLLIPALAGTTVSAKPTKATMEDDACTFTDAARAMQEKRGCSSITLSNVHVPAGQTLNLEKLNDNTRVIFSGKTTFGYAEWAGALVSVSGKHITIEGAPDHVIDCEGQRWWDGQGTNGGRKKPRFFAVNNLVDSTINSLNVLNTPAQAFSISSVKNLGIFDVSVDDSLGDSRGGHNTDAFDVALSSGVYISGARVKNQDDCLAINSGNNITFINGHCSGGHAISVGSVGGRQSNDVSNVRIVNCTVSNSENGIRIKALQGGHGSIDNVQFESITLSNIGVHGIIVQQDYKNSGPTGHPTPGVPITNLTVKNVVGTVNPSGTNYYIACAACSKWVWKGNKVTGGSVTKPHRGLPPNVANALLAKKELTRH